MAGRQVRIEQADQLCQPAAVVAMSKVRARKALLVGRRKKVPLRVCATRPRRHGPLLDDCAGGGVAANNSEPADLPLLEALGGLGDDVRVAVGPCQHLQSNHAAGVPAERESQRKGGARIASACACALVHVHAPRRVRNETVWVMTSRGS